MSRALIQDALQLLSAGKFADALTLFLRLEQNSALAGEAAFYCGVIHSSQGRHDLGIAAYKRALNSAPRMASIWNNLGFSQRITGDLHDAIASFRQALLFDPSLTEARSNLGGTLQDVGEFDEGLRELEEAAASPANLFEARGSLALAKLLHGQFRDGWGLYEDRLSPAVKTRKLSLPFPIWDGRPLHGAPIFIQCEQGFGDSIQFVRYAPMVAARGGRVVIGCPVELKRLLASAPSVAGVVAPGDGLPQCAAQCLLMSLPRIFDTGLESIPSPAQYLAPDGSAVESWAGRLDARSDSRDSIPKRVGLVWAGGIHTKHDKRRSIALERWIVLGRVPGVQLYSLQKGAASAQLADSDFSVIDWTADLHDFADTAALISNLDLVITVDTAVAHLAGALGKPVWVLIHYSPDWRWMLGRNDSPWYPSMRLFRQAKPGDWDSAIGDIERALREFAAAASDNLA